jgi:uncharacterized protein YjbI with pentapeptide repeats
MNKEESLMLYNKGREAWNAWAKTMLAQRTKLEETGQWLVINDYPSGRSRGDNLVTELWLATAMADFSDHTFETGTYFDYFVFPGEAVFTGAKFAQGARFWSAKFCYIAEFNGATFDGVVRFREVTFSDVAGFKGATFSGMSEFEGAKFGGVADFKGAGFGGFADFKGATFGDVAGFGGATFSGVVEFSGATFGDFVEFEGTTFGHEAGFRVVTFGKAVVFQATFGGIAGFDGATFGGVAGFRGVTFRAHAGFAGATFGGVAGFEGATFSGRALFEGATFSSEAEFSVATFDGVAGFRGATFSGKSEFEGATFSGYAGFEGATFGGKSGFKKATFSGEAEFNETSFIGSTMFYRARFMSDARFDNARFLIKEQEPPGEAVFNFALFESYTSFYGALFEYASTFVAIKGQSFFSLKNVRFLSIPDFEQANFAEAPRLDHSEFLGSGNEQDVAVRWRALRRLAVQGHDHERELIFLAEEIKSLREVQDKLFPNPFNLLKNGQIWPGAGRYWAGLFYQWFSDFGRSTARPLLWWVIITAVFAFYFHYLSPHSDLAPGSPISIASCSGDPVTAALYLSVNNGLVISGLGRAEKLAKSYACLYGSDGKDGLSPIMPDGVVFAGLAQTILSAALIFLFLLGLRNYFRIK